MITACVTSVQTTSVFVKFLREASAFYALLTLKLQAAFGQLGFALDFPGLDDLAVVTERAVIPEFKTSLDCRISIYRCLICLGDLARCCLALHRLSACTAVQSACRRSLRAALMESLSPVT